jgi:thiosulfate dehydrogenase
VRAKFIVGIILALLLTLVVLVKRRPHNQQARAGESPSHAAPASRPIRVGPDTGKIPQTPAGDLTRYGRALIVRTADYFGPRGTIARSTNGMNCDNCHIDGGTRAYGNSFLLVASAYPRFDVRSGGMESIESRINDCFERSLNGKAIDSTSREMRAIAAYMQWVGTGVSEKIPRSYARTEALRYLDRPADPARGRAVFIATCQSCHGKNGEGKLDSRGVAYVYPPLWGAHSYNIGAGLYQISKFAAYVKNNMPYGVTYQRPQLTNEQAWDAAAFVNSQPHPSRDLSGDWPTLSRKPVDYPFGPYDDGYSEAQHKYGPFGPIVLARMNDSTNTRTSSK